MRHYISREIQAHCLKRLETGLITAISGARQVGKTTLLMNIGEVVAQRGIVSKERVYYYSLDDPLLRAELKTDFRFFEKEIEKSLGEQISKIKKPILLMIDEAQKSPDIFDWLKIIYDNYHEKVKIIISGSSSLGIRKKSTESLAGRITFLKMFPLTIRELIQDATGVSLPKESLWCNIPKKRIKDFFNFRQSLLYRYNNILDKLLEKILLEGSLPGVYISGSREEKYLRLSSIIETYLERDIRILMEVGSLDDYSNLLKILSFEVGSIFNLNSISRDIGIAYNTVKQYISVLKDTYILNSLSPLFVKARKRFVKSNKIYFFDVGVANYLSKRTEKEHIKGNQGGFLFENILLKSFESENENRPLPANIHFWRDYQGHEIDFVFEDSLGRWIPVEVSLSKNLPTGKKKNFDAFFQFTPMGKESPFGIFIYRGDLKEEKLNGKTIYLIPWWFWW